MKLKTASTRKVPRFPAALVEVFDKIENKELQDYLSAKENNDSNIAHTKKNLEHYEEMGKDFQTHIDKFLKKKEENKDATEEKARALFEQLSKHAGVESVSVTATSGWGPCVTITTPVLFTDIRKEAGSKKMQRACIGQYEMKFYWQRQNQFKIKNLIFNCQGKDHWAISGTSPCLGSYADDIHKVWSKQQWYTLFEVMYHFLLNSVDDGSAYRPSHQWRDQRNLDLIKPDGNEIKRGACVVVVVDDAEGKALKGYVGKVLVADNDHASVQFKENIGGHGGDDGSGKEGYCWNIHKSGLVVIPESLYEKKSIYKTIKSNPVQDTLAVIDKMPDGVTFEEVAAVARQSYQDAIKGEIGDL